MRKVDLHDLRACSLELRSGLCDLFLHFGSQAGSVHESGYHADTHAFDTLRQSTHEIGLDMLRRAVERIVAAQRLHGICRVFNATRERPT